MSSIGLPNPPELNRHGLERWTFLALFALSAYLFWLIAQPLWVPLFLGVLIAAGTHPLHWRLVRRFPLHESLSAALITTTVLAVMLALSGLLALVVVRQLVELAHGAAEQYRHGGSAEVLGPRLQDLMTSLGQDPERLRQEIVTATEGFAANMGQTAGRLVQASFSGVLVLMLTAVTAYFLLREGERQTTWMVGVLPLPAGQVRELARAFRDVTQAMLLGTGVTALYESCAALLAYSIAGVPRPLVWATLTGAASVVPAVGTAIIWVPISLWMASGGHVAGSVALALWCLLGMGGVANYVLRPRLLGSKMRMNDLLVFVALFGGVAAFGPLGVILGPIVTAFLVSLVHIYQRDYPPDADRPPG